MLKTENLKDDILDIKEAVAYTGFCRASLYNMVRNGQIKAFVIKTNRSNKSGKRRFIKSSIDDFLARQAIAGDAI